MEHIAKTLGNLDRDKATLTQKTIEPDTTLEQRREELRKSLRISSLENTFDSFKPTKGTEKALAAFKVLAVGKTKWQMLLCYGGVGNGKTHLCEATALTLYRRGIFCRVMTMSRIMTALKGCMGTGRYISQEELLSNYCHSEHLIIDDVGMGGSGSEWEFGQLEEIIAARYRERLFTILTTNRDISELPDRIVSRFRDPDVGRVVLNSGEDFRTLKKGL